MSSALKTIDDYIDEARILMQDEVSPYRYDDDSLVVSMNVTLLEGRRLRPDLFVYTNKGVVQSFNGKDGSELVMEEQFRLAFLHGMIGHALERDQEDIQDNRALSYNRIFTQMLIGSQGGAPPQPQGG